MFAEAEVKAEVVLGEVAATAAEFVGLDERAGGDADAGVECEPVVTGALEREAEPVVVRAGLRTKNHGCALEVFDDQFHVAVVEEITNGEAATDLGRLYGWSCLLAEIGEGAVVLVAEEHGGLTIFDAGPCGVDLRVDVSVDEEEIDPAVVVEVDEGVAPADEGASGRCDVGCGGDVGEAVVAIVAEEGGVLVAEVGDGEGEASGVLVVAEGDAHVGLLESIGVDGDTGGLGDVGEVAWAVGLVEIVGAAVVGDEEGRVAGSVEVGPDGGEAEVSRWVVETGGF